MLKFGVFCGSAPGNNAIYQQQTQSLIRYLVGQNAGIVYGGGKVGLMGLVADTALACGGQVTGVIPKHLVNKELAHPTLTELVITEDMHERKAKMAELADVFIALPGGAGTLEEIIEQWTWAQLGLHHKACILFNVNGYYDGFIDFVARTVRDGFMKQAYLDMLIVSDSPEAVWDKALSYQPPKAKWDQ
ncbi:TIGR00730 family Rossman fold protein [Dickeya oryzae]|uniref:LOG family protein n=1 Tax=Dickeya oryzae TaxID=1240404 RepID=UPI0020973CD4|nr:TIGR00730 family Rossman fold protein [Dickeya oryzae]MCO7253620.1 TIGR00730 family Rossman fold protein [Dickeya oryzae]